jgi:hypothetical protein
VVDDAAGNADQPVSQDGDHGFAVTDTGPEQRGRSVRSIGTWNGGEVVEPATEAGGDQRSPHPGPDDVGVSRG